MATRGRGRAGPRSIVAGVLTAVVAAFVVAQVWPAAAAQAAPVSTLYAWGGNGQGQVGIGRVSDFLPDPIVLTRFEGTAVRTAGGGGFSLALLADGSVWSWGANNAGQLGDGSRTPHLTPRPVANLQQIVQIAAGEGFGLAVRSDGSLWSWGSNNHGQLGNGSLSDVLTPARVAVPTNVAKVAAGNFHSVALRTNGEVWAWGSDRFGQVGKGRDLSDPNPDHWDQLTPVRTTAPYGVSQISAGGNRSMALRSAPLGGAVFAWGQNPLGALGDGTFDNSSTAKLVMRDATTIAMSQNTSYAVGSDTFLYAWGSGNCGALGDGSVVSSESRPKRIDFTGATQLAAGFDSAVAIRSDGTLWRWGLYGQDNFGCTPAVAPRPIPVPTFTSVTQVSFSPANTYLVVAAAR